MSETIISCASQLRRLSGIFSCLLALLVVSSAICQAQVCKQAPRIAHLRIVPNSADTVTLTWETDCLSDSLVLWADDGDGVDYVWSHPVGVTLSSDDQVTDRDGTTKHAVMVKGLRGGGRYWWNVRSRAVIDGRPDNNKVSIFGPHTPQVNTPVPVETAPLDFVFEIYGPHHLYKGYSAILSIPVYRTAGPGTYGPPKVKATVTLPSCMTGNWVSRGGLSPEFRGSASAAWNDFNAGDFVFRVADHTCTPGTTYRVRVDASSPMSGVTKPPQYWDLTVDPAPKFASGKPSSYPPIPCYKLHSKALKGHSCEGTWEGGIKKWGTLWASAYPGPTNNSGGCQRTGFRGNDSWTEYYDGIRVMYQLYDYDSANHLTGNPEQFLAAARSCQSQYLDNYVIPNGGGVPGRWAFAEGLYRSYRRDKDEKAKSAIQMLINRAGVGWPGGAVDYRGAREVAYGLQLNIYYQKAYGVDRSSQKALIIDNLLGMIDELVHGNAYWEEPAFDGLIAEALIKSVEEDGNPDPRIPVSLQKLADHLWSLWNPGHGVQGWYYNSAQFNMGIVGTDSRGLINLIVPLYAWLYKSTGDTKYQVEGDTIFEQGQTDLSWMGKEFSQNYRWSGKYIEWRSAPSEKEPSTKSQ